MLLVDNKLGKGDEMKVKQSRFVLEVVLDVSFFEKVKGKQIFRCRKKSEFIPFEAENAKQARKKQKRYLKKFLLKNHSSFIITTYLYKR